MQIKKTLIAMLLLVVTIGIFEPASAAAFDGDLDIIDKRSIRVMITGGTPNGKADVYVSHRQFGGSTYRQLYHFPMTLESDGSQDIHYMQNFPMPPGEYLIGFHNRTGTYKYDSLYMELYE